MRPGALPQETLPMLGGLELVVEDLQGNAAAALGVLGLVHRAHAALTEHPGDRVPAEPLAAGRALPPARVDPDGRFEPSSSRHFGQIPAGASAGTLPPHRGHRCVSAIGRPLWIATC
jgi:hypothetical protein